MKKILLSLAVVCGFGIANAASLQVTAGGNTVNNGDILEFEPELMEYPIPDTGEIMKDYEWPVFVYCAATSGEVAANVTVSSEFEGFQICWPNNCVPCPKGESKTVEGTFTTTPADLQIHFFPPEVPATSETVAVTVKDTASGETISFTVMCLAPAENAVDAIGADKGEIVEIYDLSGRRVAERQSGVNIIRYSNGKVEKVFGR